MTASSELYASSATMLLVGDGKIFVLPVDKVVRIRTGEQDSDAVTPSTEAARSG